MQAEVQGFSHKEKLGEELKILAPNVSHEDKRAFLSNSKYRKSTVSAYLNGHVSNIDTAMEMLLFFRKRIEARDKVISQKVEL